MFCACDEVEVSFGVLLAGGAVVDSHPNITKNPAKTAKVNRQRMHFISHLHFLIKANQANIVQPDGQNGTPFLTREFRQNDRA
jgi:hypothetical protein